MADVSCSRCGRRAEGLAEPPLPGAWGAAVQREVCQDCWHEWSAEQTRLINHYGLQPFKPDAKRIIYRHLHDFLKLRGVEPPPGEGPPLEVPPAEAGPR